MSKVKCYSVRLERLKEISTKAVVAYDFNGNSAILPKSVIYGIDYDVGKSEAYWIAAWKLANTKLTYSSKKVTFFDKDDIPKLIIPESDIPEPTVKIVENSLSRIDSNGVKVERIIPPKLKAIETEPLPELLRKE